MNNLPALAALAEVATGLALMFVPSLVGQLLLGAELAGVSVVIGRVTGLALVALGVACWPGCTALCGVLSYSALTIGYLAWLGIRGEFAGPLLWPAEVVHAILTFLLARMWLNKSSSDKASHRTNQPHWK